VLFPTLLALVPSFFPVQDKDRYERDCFHAGADGFPHEREYRPTLAKIQRWPGGSILDDVTVVFTPAAEEVWRYMSFARFLWLLQEKQSDSYGNLTASTGSLVNSFRYTGREFDSEANLYYYRARYYDPNAGRFLNEDPIRFFGGVQFYRYALNAPTKHRDPTGLKPGDSYDSAKVAALQALIDVLAKTKAEGAERAGVVYQNFDGTYSYTAPHRRTPTRSDPGSCPSFKNKIGTYHTHPDVPAFQSYEPSVWDLFSDFIHAEYGRIALPDGTVLSTSP
jgi:RHS repeat-associated protein